VLTTPGTNRLAAVLTTPGTNRLAAVLTTPGTNRLAAHINQLNIMAVILVGTLLVLVV
jgi:hypothetical protein